MYGHDDDHACVPYKINGQEKVPVGLMGSPPSSSAKARPEERSSRCQDPSSQDLDLNETVCWRAKQPLRQIPLLEASTSQEDSSSNDQPVVKRNKKTEVR